MFQLPRFAFEGLLWLYSHSRDPSCHIEAGMLIRYFGWFTSQYLTIRTPAVLCLEAIDSLCNLRRRLEEAIPALPCNWTLGEQSTHENGRLTRCPDYQSSAPVRHRPSFCFRRLHDIACLDLCPRSLRMYADGASCTIGVCYHLPPLQQT